MPGRTFHRFNVFAIAFFFVMVGILVAKNLLIDPYGVLGSSQLPLGSSTNQRFLKVEHICSPEAPHYDGIVLASSRSGMTDPSLFASGPSLRYYNLSVFSGKPVDMQLLYSAFTRCQGPPREVVIGLDAMAFFSEKRDPDLSQRHHPLATGQPRIAFWRDYLLSMSLLVSTGKWIDRTDPRLRFDLSDGTYKLAFYDRQIAEDHASYLSRFEALSGPPITVGVDSRQLQALQKLISQINHDGASLVVFLQPMHHLWRDRLRSFIADLRPKLHDIVVPLDLSELSSSDDRLWYEEKHYRHPVAVSVASTVRQHRSSVESRRLAAAE